MTKYEYDAVHVGSWRKQGSGIDTFLAALNARAADGWRLKSLFLHESDSYVMLERELPDELKKTEAVNEPTA